MEFHLNAPSSGQVTIRETNRWQTHIVTRLDIIRGRGANPDVAIQFTIHGHPMSLHVAPTFTVFMGALPSFTGNGKKLGNVIKQPFWSACRHENFPPGNPSTFGV